MKKKKPNVDTVVKDKRNTEYENSLVLTGCAGVKKHGREASTANVNRSSFYSNGSLGGILRCLTQSMINTLGAGKS